jgi:hypothetical protein
MRLEGMLVETDMQELRRLRHALRHWLACMTHQQEGAPLPQIDATEQERTASLLARLDALEKRAGHFAWRSGDVDFGSDERS